MVILACGCGGWCFFFVFCDVVGHSPAGDGEHGKGVDKDRADGGGGGGSVGAGGSMLLLALLRMELPRGL